MVAVWETKCTDNSLKPIQKVMVRGGMETSVGNTPGYEVYDRSAFDVIMKEHGFERSGAVNDEEIKEMGKLAGVQYIIVPEAMVDGNDFYILVKMLDVERGKFGGVHQALCTPTGSDIYSACEKLGAELFGGAIDTGNSGTSRSSSGRSNAANQKAPSISINVGNVSFEMIRVEAGSFIMGYTTEQEGDGTSDEKPAHRVTITQDYYIGKFEVTQALYQAVMGNNPSKNKARNHPVENVRWTDAQEFCSELSRMTGRRFRLPTEAEWEYAARGGNKSMGTKYSGSSSVALVAWYDDNSGSHTHPVGQLRPNELGIYDMSGNVCEWVSDCGGKYSNASQTDPIGPGQGMIRVIRGGAWFFGAKRCRVSSRSTGLPSIHHDDLGFRVVLVP